MDLGYFLVKIIPKGLGLINIFEFNPSQNNVYMYISDQKVSRVPFRLGLFPYVQSAAGVCPSDGRTWSTVTSQRDGVDSTMNACTGFTYVYAAHATTAIYTEQQKKRQVILNRRHNPTTRVLHVSFSGNMQSNIILNHDCA